MEIGMDNYTLFEINEARLEALEQEEASGEIIPTDEEENNLIYV